MRTLNGLAQLSGTSRFLTRNTSADRRELLITERRKLLKAQANAVKQSNAAPNDQVQEVWAKEVTTATNRITAVDDELALLVDDDGSAPNLGEMFETEVKFLLHGVAAMSQGDTLHSSEMVRKAHSVITTRRINILADGRLQYSCTVRLPVRGGIAALGPITWVPDEQPNLTVALMWVATETALREAVAANGAVDSALALPTTPSAHGDAELVDAFGQSLATPWRTVAGPPLPSANRTDSGYGRPEAERRQRGEGASQEYRRGTRSVLTFERHQLAELLDATGMSQAKRNTLIACPFPAAAWTVLAVHHQLALPKWVPAEWRDPQWQAWLHHAYMTDGTWGRQGVWAQASWLRQAVLDVTLDHGGRASVDEVLDALERHNIDYKVLQSLSASGGVLHARGGATGPWFWPVVRDGDWPGKGEPGVPFSSFGFRSVMCHCRRIAEVATRVGEIAGDLLCPNGHMPLAPLNVLTDGLVVPSEYQWLRVPRRVWASQLHHSARPMTRYAHLRAAAFDDPMHQLSETARRVHARLIEDRDSGGFGMKVTQLTGASGVGARSTYAALGRLAERDLVFDVANSGPGRAAIWMAR